MKRRLTYYSDAFKLGVIKRVISGEMTRAQATRYYGIGGHSSISEWMRIFGYSDNDLPRPAMKKPNQAASSADDLKRENERLRAQVLLERQRAEFYRTLIDVAERDLGVPIRKKPDIKP